MEYMSRNVAVGPTAAHVWEAGQGYPLLLMHGAGPGTSAAANFGRVRDALAGRYKIFGTDLIGFGASGRKYEPPYFDYALWLQQMQTVLDGIPDGPVGLVGHSISATFALRLAGRNPRVTKVLLSCPMGTPLRPNAHRDLLWTYPKSRDELRRSLEVLFCDRSIITDQLLDSRMQILAEPGYAEYFEKMFGGDKQALLTPTILSAEELRRVRCPVTIVHGREDLGFPIEETAFVLAKTLQQADIHALANVGHGPAAERSATFVNIATDFFG